MLCYSREEMKDLSTYLAATSKGKEVSSYLKELDKEGRFDFGFSYKGSMGSARAIIDLEGVYPEIITTLFKTPYEDLPAHINDDSAGLVAAWRIVKGKKEEPSR